MDFLGCTRGWEIPSCGPTQPKAQFPNSTNNYKIDELLTQAHFVYTQALSISALFRESTLEKYYKLCFENCCYLQYDIKAWTNFCKGHTTVVHRHKTMHNKQKTCNWFFATYLQKTYEAYVLRIGKQPETQSQTDAESAMVKGKLPDGSFIWDTVLASKLLYFEKVGFLLEFATTTIHDAYKLHRMVNDWRKSSNPFRSCIEKHIHRMQHILYTLERTVSDELSEEKRIGVGLKQETHPNQDQCSDLITVESVNIQALSDATQALTEESAYKHKLQRFVSNFRQESFVSINMVVWMLDEVYTQILFAHNEGTMSTGFEHFLNTIIRPLFTQYARVYQNELLSTTCRSTISTKGIFDCRAFGQHDYKSVQKHHTNHECTDWHVDKFQQAHKMLFVDDQTD